MQKLVSLIILQYNDNRFGSYRALFLQQKGEVERSLEEMEGQGMKIPEASAK